MPENLSMCFVVAPWEKLYPLIKNRFRYVDSTVMGQSDSKALKCVFITNMIISRSTEVEETLAAGCCSTI